MRNFRTLKVWQSSHKLTLAVYRMTRSFPSDERYGLSSQVRRAAVSIESNIAEGCGRGTPGELQQFLSNASGSTSEVECQLQIALDLQYLSTEDGRYAIERTQEIRRMLAAFIAKVEQDRRNN